MDVFREVTNLERMARDADCLEEPFVRNSLRWLAVRWNPQLAQSVHGYLLNRVPGGTLTRDVFELPQTQEDMDGVLVLGDVLGKEDIQFRHKIDRLPLHILAAGTSGCGKTNFAKVLIEEAYHTGVGCIRISDPKSEYADIAAKYPEFLLLRWNDLRFNPLTPPPNVPRNEWHQTIVGHMAQTFNFWEGAQSLLIRLLANLSEAKVEPTIVDLMTALEMEKPRYKQKDFLVMGTVSSRLELIFYTCRDIVLAESSMLPLLSERHHIIKTTGLMSEIESWLLEFMLIWEFMYRVWNPDKRKMTLHVYDECQHRLFSREKERNAHKISASLISMLVDEARAMNICICSLSQEPSSLVNAVLNNSFLKMAFHLGSGGEVRVMKEAMGLDNDQANALHYMETGEAVARLAGGFMDPIPVKIDVFQGLGKEPDAAFKAHQAEMLRSLYEDAGLGVESDEKSGSREGVQQSFGEEYDVLD